MQNNYIYLIYNWVIPWDLWHVYTDTLQIVWNFQDLYKKQF
jgi:hypothetical protein